MNRVVDIGILEAKDVGLDKIRISHLQYADDTIFICPNKMENVRIIKHILRNFEILSGLKVNFHKCYIMGLNMDRETVQNMADFLGGEVYSSPLSYLGINVELTTEIPPRG